MLGLLLGCQGPSEGVGGVRSVLGAGWHCRSSGARRGIGGIRSIVELLGVVGGLIGESEGVEGVRAVLEDWQGL